MTMSHKDCQHPRTPQARATCRRQGKSASRPSVPDPSSVVEGLLPGPRVAAIIDDWQTKRKSLREIRKANHPDITDALGRVWTWKAKDTYTHDGMAWPRDHVTSPTVGWPSSDALSNPNYQWCSACKASKGFAKCTRTPRTSAPVVERVPNSRLLRITDPKCVQADLHTVGRCACGWSDNS